MISVSTVNEALKTYYLDVLINNLNNSISPLYNKFKKTENFVTGKEIVKPVCYELSSGIAALDEYEKLPDSDANKYAALKSELKNLYGTIQITDKAMRASADTEGAVVNLLNAEMEGLIASAKQNFSRMLYGNGSGKLATITAAGSNTSEISVNTAKFFRAGMTVTINAVDRRIVSVGINKITINAGTTVAVGDSIYASASKNKEIDGLETFFSLPATLYGVETAGKGWLKPYVNNSTGNITDIKIQTAIDSAEEASGGKIDFITCSYGVRRAYQEYLETTKRNVNPVELEGGYRAISYAGIPVVADRFCPAGSMYLLDTTLFDMHQLCDWQWLEGETGNILKQEPGKAAYTATLVKYANLMCALPCGQAKLADITEK